MLCFVFFLLIPVLEAHSYEKGVELANGSFEAMQSGSPVAWTQDAYQQGSEVSKFTLESSQAHAGDHFLRIQNNQPNDARWTQRIQVKPSFIYKLTSWVRGNGIGSDKTGANISVLGVISTSQDVKDTNGKWEHVEFYGKTGVNQKEIVVAARLGGYGSLNTGIADFDDFTIEEVSSAPAGIQVVSFSTDQLSHFSASTTGMNSHSGYLAFTFIYAFLIICIRILTHAGDHNGGLIAFKTEGPSLIRLILFAGFALGIVGAPFIHGHPIDIIDFSAWSDHAYSAGLPGFYNDKMFVDYPRDD